MSWKWWEKAPAPERNVTAEMLQRARRAKSTLPVMQEAYADVREALMDAIIKSGPDDSEAREYFYHSVKGLDALVAMVEAYARQGDMAEALDAHREKVKNNAGQ